jgi:hypothetical protein
LATRFLMFWCPMVPPFLLIKPTTPFDANLTNMSPPCFIGLFIDWHEWDPKVLIFCLYIDLFIWLWVYVD